MIHPNDVERWRAKLDQIEAAIDLDEDVQEELARARRAPTSPGCGGAAARSTTSWRLATSRRSALLRTRGRDGRGRITSFGGFGQMWLNQVANNLPDDPAVVDVLVEAFTTPSSTDEALHRFAEVERVTRDLASKGQPAVGRIPYVLSIFWATDRRRAGMADHVEEHRRTACMTSAGSPPGATPTATSRWSRLPDVLPATTRTASSDAMWFLTEKQRFVGLNPALHGHVRRGGAAHGDASPRVRATRTTQPRPRGVLGRSAQGRAAPGRPGPPRASSGEVAGRELESRALQLRTSFDKDAPFRADTYAVWRLPGETWAPGFRLWATRSGVAFGVHGGWGNGTAEDVARQDRARQELHCPLDYRWFGIKPHKTGDRLIPLDDGPDRGAVRRDMVGVGRAAAGHLSSRREILRHAEALTPVLRAIADETSPEGRGDTAGDLG